MGSLVALWASYSNERRRPIRSLFAVQVLAPSPAFVRRTLAWRIVAPVAVAVCGGSALAISQSIARSISGYAQLASRAVEHVRDLLVATVALGPDRDGLIDRLQHDSD